MWLAVLACVAVSVADADGRSSPPVFPGATQSVRVLLNAQTKALAVTIVPDPELRDLVSRLADTLLAQVGGEISLQRLALPSDPVPAAEDVLAHYREWAESRSLRRIAFYRVGLTTGPDGRLVPRGLGELHLAGGKNGGILGVLVIGDDLTLLWAQGDLRLGPLAAVALGLKGGADDASDSHGDRPEPRLPEVSDRLPLDLLEARVDLTSDELIPLAEDLAAETAEPPPDSPVSATGLALIRKGPKALAKIHGLTLMLFHAGGPADIAVVREAAAAWAADKGWPKVAELGDDPSGKAELFADLSDAGGAIIVGSYGGRAGVLVTDGPPDLAALLAR